MASVKLTTQDSPGTNLTARAGVDYVKSSGTVRWEDGDTADQYFSVPIINDHSYRTNRAFQVVLSNAVGASLGSPSVADVRIWDDDAYVPPLTMVRFASDQYKVSENVRQVRILVERAGTNGAVSVQYATTNGSAWAGQDYGATAGTLTWAPGDSADKYIDVPILMDDVWRSPRSFAVSLSLPSGALGPQTTVTIFDQGVPPSSTLRFKTNYIMAFEDVGSVPIAVSRTGGSGGAVSVQVTTKTPAYQSAEAGMDFVATSATLRWAEGDTADKYIFVPIIPDAIEEADEFFTVELTRASGAAIADGGQTWVKIRNGNGSPPSHGTVAFTANHYSAFESDGSIYIPVIRTGGSFGDGNVHVAAEFGSGPQPTALPGVDFRVSPQTLTWADGNTGTEGFFVSLINNSIAQTNRTFRLVLSEANDVSLGNPSVAEVEIWDDDQEPPPEWTVQFSLDHYTVIATNHSVRIPVRRSHAESRASVQCQATNRTLALGSNYFMAGDTLTWEPGDRSDKYFEVPIWDDGVGNGDRTFEVDLSAPRGAVLGNISKATVTIFNGEGPRTGTLQFKVPAFTVSESSGKVRLEVARTGGAFGPAQVNFATTAGTALANADYLATAGTLEWADGDAADKTIEVPLVNDLAYRGERGFMVVLSGPQGAGLGDPSQAPVTLRDDEPAKALAEELAVWLEDQLPAGAIGGGTGGELWNWVATNPVPDYGTLAHQSILSAGLHQHYFYNAAATMKVNPGESLFVLVYLDPTNPPRQILVQWCDGENWAHIAYWGEDLFQPGATGPLNYHAGSLPVAGQWVRLEVPAAAVDLEGRSLNGMSFISWDGQATWDHVGKACATP